MIRCLLIDDNAFHRKMVLAAAEQSKLAVDIQEASDIRAAERMLDADQPDLILLDRQLPGEDGLSFAKRYLASRSDAAALIMLTGEGSEKIARDALQIGIVDYLSKANLSPESLEAVLTSAVTKARLLRERQAALDELKRSNQALDRFASIVAHDLRAPLRQMQTFATFLNDDHRDVLDDDGRKLLKTIGRAADRANRLIDGMLAYARLDKVGEVHATVGLRSALDDAAANLAGLIDEADASLEIGDLPSVIGMDSQLMQLFQNLIANALKFRHPERRPSIRIASTGSDGETVEITVRDNGIGIEEDDQKRIFDMLERVYSQDHYEGSGIGLATCRRIVENHGGRIWCESEPGQGSTFRLTLPRAKTKAKVNAGLETENRMFEVALAVQAVG